MGLTMPNSITHDQILAILILDFIGFKKTKIASALGIQRSTVYNHLSDFSLTTDYISSHLDIDSRDMNIYGRLSQLINSGLAIKSIYNLYQAHPPYFPTIRELEKTAHLLGVDATSAITAESKTRICRHCHNSFLPDCRHRKDQSFCSAKECRLASKKHSQQKWVLSRGVNYWKKGSK